jgi:peptidoglycan/LPS O-acetylase OafA/YrhL
MQTLQHYLWNELFTLTPFVLILLIAMGLKLRKIHDASAFHPFDVAHTMPLRGILALLVVACHMQIFFPVHHANVFQYTGVSSVAVFFFISGYGLMKSFLSKGERYLQGFLPKRFGKILPLLICLSVVNSALRMWHNHETLGYIFGGIGIPAQRPLNFSWFMYAISYVYLVFYVAARWGKNGKSVIRWMTIAVILYIGAWYLKPFMHINHWYTAIISVVSGLVVAYHEPQLQRWIVKHKVVTLVMLLLTYALVKVTAGLVQPSSRVSELRIAYPLLNYYNWLPFFVLLVVYTLGMTQNKVLYFLGQISMEIYLFHGLYTQIGLWLHISNFWAGSLFVYGFSISSAVLLWKIQQWYHSKKLKAA